MNVIVTAIGGVIAATCAYAQQPSASEIPAQAVILPSSPKTRLEQFQAKTDSVVVKGYTEVGTLTGKDGSTTTVTAMELSDISSGAKQSGITIEIKGAGQNAENNASYIDFDEIGALLKGIDSISRIDKTVTKLSNFEAVYRTKGDFAVTTFNNGGNATMASAQSGLFRNATAVFDLSDLPKLRALIQKAQTMLQAVK